MKKSGLLRALTTPVALTGLAVVLRFAFIASMGNRYYFADTAEYEAAAIRLMHGMGPGVSSPRAPLFPAEMALGFLLGGTGNFIAARMIQIALAATLSILGIRLATRLGGRATGIITGLALAFAPTLVFTTGMLYPTMLYATLLMGAASAALAAEESPRPVHGVLLGGILSLAYLTDPVAIAPALTLVVWLALQVRHRGRALANVLFATLLAAVVVLGPYMAWQKAAYGGKAVFMQKAQYVLHYSRTDTLMASERQVELPAGTPYHPLTSRDFVLQEFQLMRTQPAAYAHDVLSEFLHFFKPMPDRIQTQNQYNRGPVLLLGAVYFVPVLLFAVVGLFFGAGRARRRWALALLVLATAGFYSFFFTQTRYRIPVEPFMVVLAALGITRTFPRITRLLDDSEAKRP